MVSTSSRTSESQYSQSTVEGLVCCHCGVRGKDADVSMLRCGHRAKAVGRHCLRQTSKIAHERQRSQS